MLSPKAFSCCNLVMLSYMVISIPSKITAGYLRRKITSEDKLPACTCACRYVLIVEVVFVEGRYLLR